MLSLIDTKHGNIFHLLCVTMNFILLKEEQKSPMSFSSLQV